MNSCLMSGRTNLPSSFRYWKSRFFLVFGDGCETPSDELCGDVPRLLHRWRAMSLGAPSFCQSFLFLLLFFFFFCWFVAKLLFVLFVSLRSVQSSRAGTRGLLKLLQNTLKQLTTLTTWSTLGLWLVIAMVQSLLPLFYGPLRLRKRVSVRLVLPEKKFLFFFFFWQMFLFCRDDNEVQSRTICQDEGQERASLKPWEEGGTDHWEGDSRHPCCFCPWGHKGHVSCYLSGRNHPLSKEAACGEQGQGKG